ncbi:glycosyltransferase family 2 protein [Clostridium sp. CF011]|uniref:glycosyltransferase family 2 protein n=1 Tax=Clostridium sp. CF011 TaxID=2843318 RepID=UPI001C0C0076|nr:glycosyltransferase family 2 protein [Clostridium sp. CF011]MBU3091663.1 glycosyltransferase family 2 protein [Clostridium sp. CF011]WAG69375.1 glycosyltransferase family 2 protein [Clostridium sp. CF011]
MRTNTNVCAVVITYNIGKDIYKCVDAIKGQVDKVVIIDNGSNRDTINELAKLDENDYIKIIYNNENYGIAKALNYGVRFALSEGYEWIFTLDHDSVATENMIENMICVYENLSENERDKVAIIAPTYVDKSETETVNFKCEKYSFDIDNLKNVIVEMTSGNLVKASIFNKIGFFNEKLFIDFVDHEFCLRIKRKNYNILKVSNIILLHSLGDSVNKSFLGKKIIVTNHSVIRRYYITRNRFYCWKEFKSDFPTWVREDKLRFINEIIKIQLHEKNKLSKYKMIIKGVLDSKRFIFGKYK